MNIIPYLLSKCSLVLYLPVMAAHTGKMVDGGAATVLDLPLNLQKTLQSLQLATHTYDVVIGLIVVMLIRE